MNQWEMSFAGFMKELMALKEGYRSERENGDTMIICDIGHYSILVVMVVGMLVVVVVVVVVL